MFPVLPQFQAVDNVLPEDIAASTDAGHRREIDIGDPDCQTCVLLEHGLTRADTLTKTTTDEASYAELQDDRKQRADGNGGRAAGGENPRQIAQRKP